jgi:hypothetical protein
MVEDELDLDTRQLCPDGNCTGVIGDDGRCRICGLNQDGMRAEHVSPQEEAAADWKGMPDGDEFDARQLCPDGNCTGLLGPDGRCKVCGKSS